MIHKGANLLPQALAKSSEVFVELGFKSCVVLNVCTVQTSAALFEKLPTFMWNCSSLRWTLLLLPRCLSS